MYDTVLNDDQSPVRSACSSFTHRLTRYEGPKCNYQHKINISLYNQNTSIVFDASKVSKS